MKRQLEVLGSHRTGQVQYSRRVGGAYSRRTDVGTSASSEDVRTAGGGSKSGPKAGDDRCAPRRPQGTYCLIAGGRDIFAGIVHEGNEEI